MDDRLQGIVPFLQLGEPGGRPGAGQGGAPPPLGRPPTQQQQQQQQQGPSASTGVGSAFVPARPAGIPR